MPECKQCGRDHSKEPSPFEKLGIPEESIDTFLIDIFKQLYKFVGADIKEDPEAEDPMALMGKASNKQIHAINDLLVTLNSNFILSTGDDLMQTIQLYKLQRRQQREFMEAGLKLRYGVEVDVIAF